MGARAPTIEIHGVDPKGERYVLNHFSGENSGVQGSNPLEIERNLERLRWRAIDCVMRWQKYLPDDYIKVVEV